jgi:hypothetical protein
MHEKEHIRQATRAGDSLQNFYLDSVHEFLKNNSFLSDDQKIL